MDRNDWLTRSDAELLAECDVDAYRASGPGGQKRNKTSSAVRLRHRPSGLLVIAEESRSQHENKAKAVRRLRREFALKLRLACRSNDPTLAAVRNSEGRLECPSAKDPRYWPALAAILDQLEETSAQVREAAERLNVTTANLLAFLELDRRAWQEANILRQKFGHKPLRAGS